MKSFKTIENPVNEPLGEGGRGICNGSRRCTRTNFTDSLQPLAYEELLGQCGGNPRFVGILLEAFNLQAVKDIAALQGALSNGDADQFCSRFGCHVTDGDFAKGLDFLLENDRWKERGAAGYDHMKEVFQVEKSMQLHIEWYNKALVGEPIYPLRG